MEFILIVWNIVILVIWIFREFQNYKEKKDLLNRIMARDYEVYAKFEKKKSKPKPEYPGYMTSEQMVDACKKRDVNG